MKAVIALFIGPVLFILSLIWLNMTGFSVWILLLVSMILLDRLRREKHKVYSGTDHWFFGFLLSLLVFLSKPVFSWSSIWILGVFLLLSVGVLRFFLPVRIQARGLLKRLPDLSDTQSVLIRLDRIEIDFLDRKSSIVETNTLRQKEIEWISYRLILKKDGFKNHTVSVVSDERYGRLETILLGR